MDMVSGRSAAAMRARLGTCEPNFRFCVQVLGLVACGGFYRLPPTLASCVAGTSRQVAEGHRCVTRSAKRVFGGCLSAGGHLPCGHLSRSRSTATAPPHRRPSGGVPVVSTFTAFRLMGEVSGCDPAAFSRLHRRPSPRPAGPGTRAVPTVPRGSYAAWTAAPPGNVPHPRPYPPGLSGSAIRRRYDTGSVGTPSRLAYQARPIQQYWVALTSSRLLPPSPAFSGSGCP